VRTPCIPNQATNRGKVKNEECERTRNRGKGRYHEIILAEVIEE
jgi:hypothetical protein